MAITVGQAAPDFTLHETLDRRRSLSDYRGRNVVLAFFPGAFTPVLHDGDVRAARPASISSTP